MKKPVFTGTATALVTPFQNNQVNYTMLETLILRQIRAGIPAIVICGTTGESPTLTDAEKTSLFQAAKEIAGNRCKIIAGTGSNDTEHAVRLSIAAQQAGTDALLVVSPYYNKATPEGLFAHYQRIAESVSIPVILYNVPSRTGVDIPVSVYRRLSEIPNIVGVKEAASDIAKIAKIRTGCPEDFFIWSGNDNMIVPVMALGGIGVISVLSNLLPDEMTELTCAALHGDFHTGARKQLQLLPLAEQLFCEVNPIPVKAGMQLLGYDCGDCRMPLTPLSSENREKLRCALESFR